MLQFIVLAALPGAAQLRIAALFKVFCFRLGWGVSGIWVGLTAALVLIGVALVWVWKHGCGRD